MQNRLQPGLRTLITWGWDWCLFFDEGEHHEADFLAEGTSLVKSQLTPSVNYEERRLSIEEFFEL
ncbi:MAG: hypothetical protein ACRDHW_16600 [Ktedonobacteraceae bacterium]